MFINEINSSGGGFVYLERIIEFSLYYLDYNEYYIFSLFLNRGIRLA
jgi:hypothetical protein